MILSRKKSFGLLAVGVSALVLGGCSISHPNIMPSGYTHHGEVYKSPAPPSSPKITAQQRQYMDAVQAEQFRDAVYDLLSRVTARAGMPPKPVYVLTPNPMTTFYANIDNDLREGMRHIGYALSDMPEGAYVFAYDARFVDQPRDADTIGPNVELVLKVFSAIGVDARMLTEESGQYYIQGADTLNIKPANYRRDLIPSRETIMRQASGFNERRTVTDELTQNTASPAISYSSGSAADFQAVETPAPRLVEPTEVPVNRSYHSGPSQAVVIDSSGISYDDSSLSYEEPSQVNKQPLSSRPRVSPRVEY